MSALRVKTKTVTVQNLFRCISIEMAYKKKKRLETTTLEGIMIAFTTFCKTLRLNRFGSVQFDT